MFPLVIALLFWMCAPAHSQLGEGKSINSIIPTSEEPLASDYYNEVVYTDDDYAIYVGDRGYTSDPDIVWSRTVDQTYQGCMQVDKIINATFIYFNLTQEEEEQFGVKTVAEACFDLCLKQDPFSFFISVNAAVGGNNDACGCHAKSELDLEDLVYDDSNCDEDAEYVRVFCGPENSGCINASSIAKASNLLLFLASLIATVFRLLR